MACGLRGYSNRRALRAGHKCRRLALGTPANCNLRALSSAMQGYFCSGSAFSRSSLVSNQHHAARLQHRARSHRWFLCARQLVVDIRAWFHAID